MEWLNHRVYVFSASLPTTKHYVFQSGLRQFTFSSTLDESSGCFKSSSSLELVNILYVNITMSVYWYFLLLIVVDFIYLWKYNLCKLCIHSKYMN